MIAAVLGGTFAPPTVAHLALMQHAMQAISADKGIFVPSNLSYMRLWRDQNIPDPFYLADEHRVNMLKGMIADHSNMDIFTYEMDQPGNAYTYDTLCALKPYYDKIYFIIGSDNLKSLDRWHAYDRLMSEFEVLAASRRHESIREIAAANPALQPYLSRIHPLPMPSAFTHISASKVREEIACGAWEAAKQSLSPAVFDYLHCHLSRA